MIGESIVSGAKWTLILSVLQRVLLFLMNQCMLRLAGPEIFGVASIQLELLLSTLLFLSREGVRLAVLKLPQLQKASEDEAQQRAIVNISWLPALILLLVSISAVCYDAYCMKDSSDSGWNSNSGTFVTTVMYIFAAFLEAMGEPWFNTYAHDAQTLPRLRAETGALIARAVTLVSVLYLRSNTNRYEVLDTNSMKYSMLTAFGYGQLAFGASSLVILISHSFLYKKPLSSSLSSKFLPDAPWTWSFREWELFKLAYTTTSMSLFKHILTQADRIVLSLLVSSYDQGVYAAAANYGSLVARTIFLPIEDSARLIFSNIAAQGRSKDSGELVDDKERKKDGMRTRSKTTNKIATSNNSSSSGISNSLVQLASILGGLLRVTFLIGLIIATFGPLYIRAMVRLLLGLEWSNEQTIWTLMAFCPYVLSLGLNGVSEAFIHCVASAENGQFVRINIGLLLSSAVFTVSVYPLVTTMGLGTMGVVVANTLSMIVRIVWNLMHIRTGFIDPSHVYDMNIPNDHRIYSNNDMDIDDVDINSEKLNIIVENVWISWMDVINIPLVSTLVVCIAAAYASSEIYAQSSQEAHIKTFVIHVATGGLLFVVFLVVCWRSHVSILHKVYSEIKALK
jgi:oligosaccharide translocation protein RFT1